MWLILFISTIFTEGTRIDEAMEFFRHNYNQQITQGQQRVFDDITPAGPKLLQEFTLKKFRAEDLIIGDTPAETLSVTGYFYHEGNIIIINDGVLRVKNADFNLDGNIYIINQGEAAVGDCRIYIFIWSNAYRTARTRKMFYFFGKKAHNAGSKNRMGMCSADLH